MTTTEITPSELTGCKRIEVFQNAEGRFKGRFGYKVDGKMVMCNLASERDAMQDALLRIQLPIRSTKFLDPWFGCNIETRIEWVWHPIKNQPCPKHIRWTRGVETNAKL